MTSASAGNNTNPVSLSQPESYISLSSGISKAPDLSATAPPLEFNVSDGLTLSMKLPCYSDKGANLPSNPKLECLWGDKEGKKSVFLFGDSQAATWLPAFNQNGLKEHFKVYFLAEVSCPPWESLRAKNFTMTTGLTYDECTSIVSKEVHFATTIHPLIVVLAGDDKEISTNKWPATITDYNQEFARIFSSLKPSGSQNVVLSQVLQYSVTTSNPMTPTTCLTVHGSVDDGVVRSCISSTQRREGIASSASITTSLSSIVQRSLSQIHHKYCKAVRKAATGATKRANDPKVVLRASTTRCAVSRRNSSPRNLIKGESQFAVIAFADQL